MYTWTWEDRTHFQPHCKYLLTKQARKNGNAKLLHGSWKKEMKMSKAKSFIGTFSTAFSLISGPWVVFASNPFPTCSSLSIALANFSTNLSWIPFCTRKRFVQTQVWKQAWKENKQTRSTVYLGFTLSINLFWPSRHSIGLLQWSIFCCFSIILRWDLSLPLLSPPLSL